MSGALKKTAKLPTSPERRALLAQIHIAKKELGLSDSDYRAVLHSVYQVESAKDLSNTRLRGIVGHFQKLGWKGGTKRKFKARSKGYRSPSKRAVVRKIYVLWSILYKNEKAKTKRPDGYVRRMTKTEARPDGIANVEWLENDEAYSVIEALKKWIEREELGHLLVRD